MTAGILSSIHTPADVHALSAQQLRDLCFEIRTTLLDYGRKHGGHIGSNLGVVELTVALHRVFNSPHDRFIFDVSHQSYVHKMLTGRAEAYLDESRFGEVTGFTNPLESEHDSFVLGHTGTSISLACGLAKTRDMQRTATGESTIGNVVAIIGDGSLSSAIAFEGLNNAAEQGGNLIIIVNDNEMSIAEDFGGMYGQLAKLRASDGTAELNLFKAFGLDYRYVEQGNDVDTLVEVLNEVKGIDHPIVVHIHTTKGLGFDDGEESDNGSDGCNQTNPQPHAGKCEANHWQDPEASLGKPLDARKYYGEMAMASLERRFSNEPGLVVISPATPGSNGITRDFRERAGAHYVDSGITEEHAAAFAAGIAKAGGRPVLATSATFFQRTFDQLQQELALNHVPATLLIFGAGISGADNTHSGTFDMTMFANVPDVTCLAPASGEQMLDMLAWATGPSDHGVVAIRMPGEQILSLERAADMLFDPLQRAEEHDPAVNITGECPFSRYRIVQPGKDVAILGLGNTMPLAAEVTSALAEDDETHAAITTTLVDALQYSTMDAELLTMLADGHRLVVTLEDGQLEGGWGEKVTAFYANSNNTKTSHVRVLNFGASKEFTDRVPLDELNERYGLTAATIVSRIHGILNE
ncbi:1-deoxy-D-xylulose-5-phosphate synthase [Bifidobacterium catenulatum]|uniref:1-deoxy-D-xylulose-5-phosphate synthase n=1 Tax=Bifidobacterium catenulatum subsp. kashiwanohense TaxID=630129 RepID=A0AAJ1P9E9_9BIFI|nr:1-deoxy-D-xylulose-5-phosphate synthase [Bifidobacterium catenulatum]KFI66857.1 1-deoxy-D-xylulose-5-phosphate synthase [Bifidobacterium catenulatum subsp. kashiwanohense JCM 15439 = DSM 21854]MDH7870864.1 1-deoxy-D-xylulose-5-phosphate synthase [Bifidobacterium catenulatum subsp. kashiwanohense]MDH7885706.1 1-deoxy-D-xylulose-5-phosphate synthase [Bifidobacterium catenulatum subsp. kashiwanohense]MDH7899197.1 1-deoxy-D-xylulose-5-phosphate synthase [Bifidobacterium catenulatum subsp. kashiw